MMKSLSKKVTEKKSMQSMRRWVICNKITHLRLADPEEGMMIIFRQQINGLLKTTKLQELQCNLLRNNPILTSKRF
jgi:hypothetical protein